MSDQKFQPGDVVRLKSGGPNMTIDKIGMYDYETNDSAMCVWFDNTKQMKGRYQFASLELVKE